MAGLFEEYGIYVCVLSALDFGGATDQFTHIPVWSWEWSFLSRELKVCECEEGLPGRYLRTVREWRMAAALFA
jgi:hypothetical protein